MRKFEVKSSMYTGAVVFVYENNELAAVSFVGTSLSCEQKNWFLKALPQHPEGLARYKGLEITEVLENIDFDTFWNRYNDKARSSKLKTKRAWDKMSRAEQVKAYNYIPKYEASIPYGVCKKYATTYLSDQLWNN